MSVNATPLFPVRSTPNEIGGWQSAAQSTRIMFGQIVKHSNKEKLKSLLKISRIKFSQDLSLAKIYNKARSVASITFSTSYNMLSGAVLSCLLDLLRNDGAIIQILNSVIHHDHKNSAGKFFGYLKTLSAENGYESKLDPKKLEKFSFEDIDNFVESGAISDCNRDGYATFFKKKGINVADSDQTKMVFCLAMLHSLFEEAVCREIVQDLILKCLVKRVVQRISPQHTSKVDSKIYAACRILLSSYVFVIVRSFTKPYFFTNLGVEIDMQACFIMGIFLGLMKEVGGAAASFGANAINKAALMMPLETWVRCQASK
jgi:hypothetical protein